MSALLDPADEVVARHLGQQLRVIAAHMAADHLDHLVVGGAVGHEPAFASDELWHGRGSTPSGWRYVGARLSLRIQVCGRVAIERDGQRLEGALPGRQGRLIFVYLVAHRLRPLTRDELADALWGDAPPER